MDQTTLRRLADAGIAELPPTLLPDLIQYCWDRCEIDGDARYCVIARTLEPIDRVFEERDEAGGVPTHWLEQLDAEIVRRLPAVLDEPEVEAASLVARSMRDEIYRLLLTIQ